MRLVLNTNVLLAAFLARGTCNELVEHCEKTHEIVLSEFILREMEGKLVEKFHVPAGRARVAVQLIRSTAEIVSPLPLERPVCRDPDDDRVLATAVVGRCRCLVTGDQDLLVLGQHESVQILAPGAFWSFEARNPA